MAEQKIIIANPSGLHARPVSKLVQLATKYACDVSIESKGKSVNAKSILGVMSLGVSSGDEITVCTNGPDEDIALAEIIAAIKEGLGELAQG